MRITRPADPNGRRDGVRLDAGGDPESQRAMRCWPTTLGSRSKVEFVRWRSASPHIPRELVLMTLLMMALMKLTNHSDPGLLIPAGTAVAVALIHHLGTRSGATDNLKEPRSMPGRTEVDGFATARAERHVRSLR